jgi:hypothetical protein
VEVLEARMAPGLIDRVELLEHRLLDAHLLEHGLDDEVGVGRCRRSRAWSSSSAMRCS